MPSRAIYFKDNYRQMLKLTSVFLEHEPKVVVEWLELVLHIREIPNLIEVYRDYTQSLQANAERVF